PSHIKLLSKVKCVIANGVECEPLLQIDQRLMENFPNKIITGLKLAMKATGAGTGIIALKKKYKQAIMSISRAIKKEKDIEFKTLDNIYPMGDEQTLTYEITKRIVPETGLPLDVDVLVHNVGTLYNIFQAWNKNPVIDKFITVTGDVAEPATMNVPIGTPFQDLLKKVGGPKEKDFVLIKGGPMMGCAADPDEEVVTKTSSGFLILPQDHILSQMKNQTGAKSIKLAKTLCIQCNTCTEHCPRYQLGHRIKPHLLMRKIGLSGIHDGQKIDEKFNDAFLCCECGVCTFYSCPMGLNPQKVIQGIKNELLKNKIERKTRSFKPQVRSFFKEKSIPFNKLLKRLHLAQYDHKIPFLPDRMEFNHVLIPLKQHIGQAAKPKVKKGQSVKKADLIADVGAEKIGAGIHASITGKIVKITDSYIEIKR
ncbi:MAG: SLBB domain-containing protein, partial [Spirochaetes bacterium]|nr:SLBB domain-containing protein [Spirochaetota bacterium]